MLDRAITTAERVRFEGEGMTPGDVLWDSLDDVEEAMALWRAAQARLAATKEAARVAGEVVAGIIGNGGAFGYGDSVVRYKKGGKSVCIDPNGVIGLLTMRVKDDTVDLGDVVNPQYVKRSWMDDAVRDTFYEWVEDDEASLTIVPPGRVPKFLQHLGDGEVFQ